MKSKFFGNSAKLALAAMTVFGTLFTSCYEKADADPVIPPAKPEPAKYYIVGSIVDATTLQPLDATVTVGGAAVTVTNGAFKHEVTTYTGDPITVKAEKAGTDYFVVTKNVYLQKVSDGQIGITNVDIAMFKQSYLPGETPQSKEPKRLSKEDVVNDFGFNAANTTVAADGAIVVTQAATTATNKVTYNNLKGFIMSGVAARTIDDDIAYSVSKDLNKTYMGKKFADFATETITLDYAQDIHDSHGVAVSEAKVKQIMEAYEYEFAAGTVTVITPSKAIIDVVIVDKHGNQVNSGGGLGDSTY